MFPDIDMLAIDGGEVSPHALLCARGHRFDSVPGDFCLLVEGVSRYVGNHYKVREYHECVASSLWATHVLVHEPQNHLWCVCVSCSSCADMSLASSATLGI